MLLPPPSALLPVAPFALPPPDTVAPPVDPELLAADVAALPPGSLLAAAGDLEVRLAAAAQVPHVLSEIARLRELTFREAGEGTGQSEDRDRFDGWYLHLFLWNSSRREVAGAYRLGLVDRILPERGPEGTYASTLFEFPPSWWRRVCPSIELGRSFLQPAYQRKFAPLLLLWRGIGEWVARNPHYRYLYGPASISALYSPAARMLMVLFLERTSAEAWGIRPRCPFRPRTVPGSDLEAAAAALGGMDELDAAVAGMEQGRAGVPVLVRQYAALGGRFLAFNRDERFSDALDGLVLVDLHGLPQRLLERYLGREGAAGYRAHNALGD